MRYAARKVGLLSALAVLVFVVPQARAVFVDYTAGICGSFDCSDSANGSETTKIYATGDWAADSDNFVISWDVDFDSDTNLFRYTYSVSAPNKELSHLLIEVSSNFTADDVEEGSSAYLGPEAFGNEGGSSPGLPVTTLYSLKFDTSDPFVIYTYRTPMFGSFYAVDGKGDDPVYAYNTGLDPGNANDFFIPVPDTAIPIPEPGTLSLLASGLIGMGALRRRGIDRA
jgi:hypothetical protein